MLNNDYDLTMRAEIFSLRDLEHDGYTFDHEGPLIINGAQIQWGPVQLGTGGYLFLIVIFNLLYLSIYLFIKYFLTPRFRSLKQRSLVSFFDLIILSFC